MTDHLALARKLESEILRLQEAEREMTRGPWSVLDEEFTEDGEYSVPLIWAEKHKASQLEETRGAHVAEVRIGGQMDHEANANGIVFARNHLAAWLAADLERVREAIIDIGIDAFAKAVAEREVVRLAKVYEVER